MIRIGRPLAKAAIGGAVMVFVVLAAAPRAKKPVQDPFPGREEITRKDFNADGVPDTLTRWADGGSSFGGDFVTLKDGRTGSSYAYNTWGSYGQFLRLIPFDNALLEPANKGFREALERALFPGLGQAEMESSLAWLVDVYSRAEDWSSRPGDSLFASRNRFEPRWAEGEIRPPVSSYLVTSDETLLRNYPIRQEDNPGFDASHRQAWLVYYGDNHGALEPVPVSAEVRVFKSAHGVAVSEAGRFCWAFVSDEVFADGPAKLRWPSIKDVRLSDGLLFIHHAGSEEHLYVVDYRAGVAGRVVPERFPASGGAFEVRDGRLFLRGGPRPGAVDLGALKTSLR